MSFLISVVRRSTPALKRASVLIRFLSSESISKNDQPVDVVVVGAGLAGLSGAISAAEKGASVLMIDRQYGGGASSLSGGYVYAGGGTRHQREAGFDDTVDNFYNYIKLEVGDVVSDATLRKFCNDSVSNLEWLEKHGVEFGSTLANFKSTLPHKEYALAYTGNEHAYPYRVHARPVPRGHRPTGGGFAGIYITTPLLKSAANLGITLLPASRAEKIIMGDKGAEGVVYRYIPQTHPVAKRHRLLKKFALRSEGFMPDIAAALNSRAQALWEKNAIAVTTPSKAVILSAGGFSMNKEWRRKYIPPPYMRAAALGTEADDGGGISLGLDVGGTLSRMHRMSVWRFIYGPTAMVEGVAVTPNGQRFAAEDLYGAHFSERMIKASEGRGYLILDSAMIEKARKQFAKQSAFPFMLINLYQLYWANSKASTLEGLAQKLKIPPSELSKTIDDYNRAIAAKAEDEFHKHPNYCVPLATPPFYGIDITIQPSGMAVTTALALGGLKVSETTGQLLDQAGKEVTGVYAAGRTAVGICSENYVSGLSLADCVFSGRRAGEHAASHRKK